MNNNTATLSPETLPAIMWNNQAVITTALLAGIYGAKEIQIQQNFINNTSRFIEGVHFFKLVGAELKAFKNLLDKIELVKIAKNTAQLMLWTERGTVRHAKILDTDNAWLVQDRLEDSYFAKNAPVQYGLKSLPPSPYISEAEASQLKKSLATHCQKTGVNNYAELYGKIYAYFGITSYLHIPAGKLPEAARLIGVKLVAVKKPPLPAEPTPLTFTPEELETIIADRVKAIQGELVSDNPAGNTITISLRNDHNHVRYLVMKTNGLTTLSELVPSIMVGTLEFLVKENFEQAIKAFNAMGFLVIEKSKLEEANIKQLGEFLA